MLKALYLLNTIKQLVMVNKNGNENSVAEYRKS